MVTFLEEAKVPSHAVIWGKGIQTEGTAQAKSQSRNNFYFEKGKKARVADVLGQGIRVESKIRVGRQDIRTKVCKVRS